MRVTITPPNPRLTLRVKSGKAAAGISSDEAVSAANAALRAREDDARVELERRILAMRQDESRNSMVNDTQHGLLRSARQIADMGGSFGFHLMTAVGRSLEGYLLALMNQAIVPDSVVVDLHLETLHSLLARDASGAPDAEERLVLDGLQQVVQRSLGKHGLSALPS